MISNNTEFNKTCLNKIDLKNSLKEKSPLYNKMKTCDICKKTVSESIIKKYENTGKLFCGTCIVKGKDDGYFTKCPKTGHKIFIPIIKKTENLSINYNKKVMDGFVKFQLLEYSKCPSNQWSTVENTDRKKLWKKNKTIRNNCGVGIPCGKINNITVIDLDDYKWNDEHEFIKTFGRDYTKFNTYTQKSGKGGIHLFFEYDTDLYNTCVSDTSELSGKGIDILNDINSQGKYAGKYVVGAGTTIRFSEKDKQSYNLNGDFGTYTVLNEKPVIKMPENLKKWLLDNCYNKNIVSTRKVRQQREIAISNEVGYFNYDISKDELRRIFKKFINNNVEYWNSYDKYIITLTALKSLSAWWLVKELFDEFSGKDNFKERVWNKQVQHWNGIKKFNEYNCFNHILKLIDERTILDYVKYKPTYNPEIKFDKCGEYDKIGKHIKLDTKTDYAIMSGTGTGKTTIVKKDILPKTQFISIVSRRTLAYEQYKVFSEDDIDCIWYETYEKSFIPENNNVVIQIDSLMKLSHYVKDISNYSVFLDEYSSLIEHLITSPTLNKTRALIFKIFSNIIKNARQVVCVDADINKYTLDVMEFLGRKMEKINNTFNHNQGVECQEYFQIESIVKEMKSKEKFLCCLDSARLGKALVEEHFNTIPIEHTDEKTIVVNGEEINKYSMDIYQDEKGFVVFISAENDFMPNLDEWERVFFSPKIVYGLDSTMTRDVFAIYKEHTISPRGMLQQIARCRNITKLHYIFFKKRFIEPNYIDIPEVEESNKKFDEMAMWTQICDEESCKLFIDLLSTIMYNKDCMNTNKFCHFKLLLKERGFKEIKNTVGKTQIKDVNSLEKESRKKEINNFDIEKPKYKKINEMLKIPDNQIENYCDLFVNSNSLQHYFNITSYLLKNDELINSKLEHKEEFNVMKVQTSDFKIYLLQKFMMACGCENKFDINPKKKLNENDSNAWFEKLDKSFRFRMKEKVDLKEINNCKIIIEKMMKQLFGGSMKSKTVHSEEQIESGHTERMFDIVKLFNSERKQINKKRIVVNTLNKDFFNEAYKIMEFQNDDYIKLKPFNDFDAGWDKTKADNVIES